MVFEGAETCSHTRMLMIVYDVEFWWNKSFDFILIMYMYHTTCLIYLTATTDDTLNATLVFYFYEVINIYLSRFRRF